MNKRIRGLILPIPLLLAGQAAQALGLGELKVESALEQPLKGQIRLILNAGESLEKVQVKLAASEDYERVGLDPTLVPPTIELAVRQGPQGPYIEITSSQPITEPIVSLLLEADWPKGRLLREYTLLLDPPSYAPVASVAPARLSQPESFDRIVQEQPAAEPPVAEPVPQPQPEPEPEPVAEEPALTRGFPLEEAASAANEVEVTAGSTLWSIASQNRRPGVSVQQMMVAILRANPDAFLDGNMNQLKKGSVLRIPGSEEAADVSQSEALAEVASHSQQWVHYQDKARDMVPAAYQTQTSEEEPAPSAVASNDYELDLVPPKGESDSDTSGSGTTATENPSYAELALAREDLATLEQEKQELASRIEELESIVNDQQAVLQMKDADMAKLQQQLAELNQKRQQLEGNVKDVQDSIRSMDESPHDMADQAVADLAQETPDEGETAQATEEMVNDQALEDTAGEAEAHDVWDQQEALAEAADGTEVVNANESTDENQTAPMEDAGTEAVEEPVLVTETPTAPAETTAPAENDSWWQKALNWITGNPLYAAGAALLLLLIGLLPRILRKDSDELEEDSAGGSFLDSIAARGEEADVPEVNIEELLERIEQEPENVDLLYEAALYYYGENDQQNFENMAEELYGRLADPNHPKWQEIAELGQKIAPENALFGVGSLTEDHEAFDESPAQPEDDTDTETTDAESAHGEPETVEDNLDQWQIPEERAEADGEENKDADGEPMENEFSFDLDEFIPATGESADQTAEQSVNQSEEDSLTALEEGLGELTDDVEVAKDTVAETFDEVLEETTQAAEEHADDLGADMGSSVSEEAELDLSLDNLESELDAIELEDTEDTDLGEEDVPVVDLTADLDIEDSEDLMDFDFGEETPPAASEENAEAGDSGATEEPAEENLDEEAADLGFNLDDIVPEGDAVATKLDLARAYFEMGDIEGARIMLDEVSEEGNAEQQAEARKLRDEIDGS